MATNFNTAAGTVDSLLKVHIRQREFVFEQGIIVIIPAAVSKTFTDTLQINENGTTSDVKYLRRTMSSQSTSSKEPNTSIRSRTNKQ